MAGAGAKLFTDGSVLNAAQVNTFLMDQAIMRFANATARDAAFGGAGEPTVAEGMMCYLDDTNVVQSYNGTAWVTIADTDAPFQNPSGLELITPTSVTGAAGSLSGAIVTVSAGGTIIINGVFTATYRNYRLVWDSDGNSAGGTLRWRLASGGTAQAGGYTTVGSFASVSGGTGSLTAISSEQAVATGIVGSFGNASAIGGGTADIMAPAIAISTQVIGTSSCNSTNSGNTFYTGGSIYYTSVAGDGIELSPSTGTWSGRVRIYGYRN